MYNRIENEFIKKSKMRKFGFLSLIISVLYIIIYLIGIIMLKFNFLWMIILLMAIALLIFISLYLNIYLYVKRKNKKKIDFFKFKKNTKLYKRNIHKNEVSTLKRILKKNNVTSQDSLLEIINHYRIKMPTNIKKTPELIAILSLIISLFALFSADVYLKNAQNAAYVLAIIFIITLVFYSYKAIKHMVNSMFGKNELYIRMELILSEIYISYPFNKKWRQIYEYRDKKRRTSNY